MNERQKISLPPDEWVKTREYMERVKKINDRERELTRRAKKSIVHTFGCQMNAHDSEKIEYMLTRMGYEKAEDEKDADLVLYNTCCIRENAENKIYGNLGFLKHLKENKPELKVVLCGCMMQQDAVIQKIEESHRHVDVIFGTYNLHQFPQLLHTSLEVSGQLGGTSLHGASGTSLIIDVWPESGEIMEAPHQERKSKYKASVNIMYGCDNYCSYCIVPYVRGRERSRDETDIVREVEELARDGVKEIMLLGQNVNSYGCGAKEDRFARLLRRLNQIEGIERIRFMTSHPKDLSDGLIAAIRDCENVCRHIHLPVQSGSTEVLRRMNRKYSKDDYLRLVDKIKTEVPGILITTDIIVGFPGETEDDFLQTLEIVRKVRFSGVFTFLYSKRAGTPAAGMDNPVPEEVANERFQRLVREVNGILLEINQDQLGRVVRVLPEEINKNDDRLLTGRTEQNAIVHFSGVSDQIGQVTDVKIIGCKTFYLVGEPMASNP